LIAIGVYLLVKLKAPSAVGLQPSALIKKAVPQADGR
jgi:hypothetical protein